LHHAPRKEEKEKGQKSGEWAARAKGGNLFAHNGKGKSMSKEMKISKEKKG